MDDPAQPMTDADLLAPAGNTFEPASPLKDQGDKLAAYTDTVGSDVKGKVADAAAPAVDQAKQQVQSLSAQATDKARQFAEQGKERATGALEQIVQMLNDAAGQVDGKLGEQYGQYARQAAGTVSGLADQVRDKNVDELFDDAREFVRKSPAVAIGAAAAIGFVLTRLVSSGLDNRDQA